MAGVYDKVWMVTQDGKPLRRGLTKSQADKQAAELARGFESHRANDKRRVAEFDVKLDRELIASHDANWNWLKEQ
jgi:hypothetical protein